MKRSVVKQGTSTFTISLPSRWARNVDIDAGSLVDVEENGKELVVRASGAPSLLKKEIDISGLNDSLIRRYIITSYIRGIDELKVVFSEKKEMRVVEEVLSSLVGFAIVESEGDYFTVKEVSAAKQEEFDPMLKRIFFTLKSIGDDIIENSRGRRIESLKDLKYFEDTGINRLSYLCMRILNKKGYKDYSKTNSLYEMVRFLENTGDEYWEICKEIMNSGEISNEVLDIFKDANDLILELYFCFYNHDKKMLNRIYTTAKEIRKNKAREMILKSSKEEILIVSSIKKIAELVGSIIETQMMLLL